MLDTELSSECSFEGYVKIDEFVDDCTKRGFSKEKLKSALDVVKAKEGRFKELLEAINVPRET